jgi:cholesterol transport system auxiliary component
MDSTIRLLNKTGSAAMLCLASLLLGGCTVFQPVKHSNISTYALEAKFEHVAQSGADLTLQTGTPTARPGYDSRRMVYIKKPHEIEYFAQNQWVDSPARMLAPLLKHALESSGAFRAVVNMRSAVLSDLHLDTEIIRFQHEFLTRPSQVHLTVRAELIEMRSKQVLATREFDVSELAASDDPYAGVIAANRALHRLLLQLAEFSAEQSKGITSRSKPE